MLASWLMGKMLLLAVMLTGCVTEVADDTVSTEQDIHGDTDGWGQWCNNTLTSADEHLYKTCHNVSGEEGICDYSVCRRWCTNPQNRTGCPHGFHAVPIQGDGCFCEPDLKPWESDHVSPAADW